MKVELVGLVDEWRMWVLGCVGGYMMVGKRKNEVLEGGFPGKILKRSSLGCESWRIKLDVEMQSSF